MVSECVCSIKRHTCGISYEIIIVDNASGDYPILTALETDNVIIIENKQNSGFGAANNIGYLHSKGNYILCLNPDTLLVDNSLYKIISFQKSVHQNVCCGGILTDLKGLAIHSFGTFPTLKTFFHQYVHTYLRNSNSKPIRTHGEPYKVEYITGADLCIPRSVIEKYGFYDERFFMYYEETELQYRYAKHGVFSYIIPSVRIIHLDGGSFPQKIGKLKRVLQGSITYADIVFNKTQYIIFRLMTFTFNLPKIILYKGNVKEKIDLIKLLIR